MSNPFADSTEGMDSNPFSDPTISSALHSSSRMDYGGEREGDEEASISSTPRAGQSSSNLGHNNAGGGGGRTEEMASRFDDLARREQELSAREATLNAKAEHIRKHGRNNWPPGPFPLIFHDIEMEIPEDTRSVVLTLYRIWMFLIIVLLVNLVGAIFLLISGANNGGSDLGAAIMYVPVIGILSFFTWYRPVYNAYMKESAVFYYIYFLFAGFHIAFCTYAFIGIPSSGAAGLINLISRFATGHITAGVFCILTTVGWAMQGLASLWMYRLVWAHSHGEKGYTFAQAQQEAKLHGMTAYFFKASKIPA